MRTASEAAVKAKFREKYPYVSEGEIDKIYNTALGTYLDLSYPFEESLIEVPATKPRAYIWIRDCMDEIMERNGITATSYSENGLSYEWDNEMISDILRRRLIGKAKIIG